MDYTPRSQSDIDKERLNQGAWPVGDYDFEILDQARIGQYDQYTQEKISQQGNPMIQLVMLFLHPSGAKRVLRDYILDNNAVKLHDAMIACGLQYGTGKIIAQDFIGKRGKAKLGLGKDGYNEVKGYILSGAKAPAQAADSPQPLPQETKKSDPLADEIPF